MKASLAKNELLNGIKRMTKFILAFSLLFGTPIYAQEGSGGPPAIWIMAAEGIDCPNVAPIEKGQPAPCDGFYFSDEAEKQAAGAKQDAEYTQKINDQLVKKSEGQAKENEILERRLNLYIQQSEVLSKDVARRETNENLYRVLYFGLGAVLTGFIAANVQR